MIDYRKLELEAVALILASQRMQEAAQSKNDHLLLLAYCEIIVHHERIRDIVARRESE